MVKQLLVCSLLLFGLSAVSHADQLDEIKKSGSVRIAVYDNSYPFSFLDIRNNKLTGFNIDLAEHIAHELGVKNRFVITKIGQRVSLLESGKVDLVIANLTVTPAREKEIAFSVPYFVSGQKFIARKGALSAPDDLNNLRIGVNSGSVTAEVLSNRYPSVSLVYYDDLPFSFTALRNGNIQAISDDDAKLIGFFARLPTNQKVSFELSPFAITKEYQAIGIRKGEPRLVEAINAILLKMEKGGEMLTLYNRWFGPQTETEIPRGGFQITQ